LAGKTPKDLIESCIFSGWLYKRGGPKGDKAWKKRYFILSVLGLSYFKSNGPVRSYLSRDLSNSDPE